MQVVICAAIAAIGAENLLCAHVSQLVFAKNLLAVPVLPFVPAIPIFVYLVGMALLAGGVSVAASIRPRFASIFLGLFFLLWVLVLLVPKAIARPLDLNVRMCVFEVLALGSSALTLAGCLQEEHGPTVGSILGRLIDKLIASAPYLFAMSSVVFGVTHFLIPRIIVSLEPDWSLAACSGHTSRARGSSLLVSASQAASWRGGFLAGDHVSTLVLVPPCFLGWQFIHVFPPNGLARLLLMGCVVDRGFAPGIPCGAKRLPRA
jgi:hypothetical protein